MFSRLATFFIISVLLLGNALNFTPRAFAAQPNTKQTEYVSVAESGRQIDAHKAKIKIYIKNKKLHVKDNGYGIKTEVMNLLFQKNITTEGYGVGLNFCKEAMLKMNGNIECKSKEGFGAEFILSFNN